MDDPPLVRCKKRTSRRPTSRKGAFRESPTIPAFTLLTQGPSKVRVDPCDRGPCERQSPSVRDGTRGPPARNRRRPLVLTHHFINCRGWGPEVILLFKTICFLSSSLSTKLRHGKRKGGPKNFTVVTQQTVRIGPSGRETDGRTLKTPGTSSGRGRHRRTVPLQGTDSSLLPFPFSLLLPYTPTPRPPLSPGPRPAPYPSTPPYRPP